MESYNMKDFEKPFQIIPENLDGFNQKVKEMSELTGDKMKQLLSNTKSIEKGND